MIGQLAWDGAVAPISDVTWDNVLETATRFRGLEVNKDFYLTFKDEDGNVIDIHTEDDLVAAIRIAEEQQVPCLCLNVPFSSTDSEVSDSEWIELDESASPRPSYLIDDITVPSTQQLDEESEIQDDNAKPEEQSPDEEGSVSEVVEQEEPPEHIDQHNVDQHDADVAIEPSIVDPMIPSAEKEVTNDFSYEEVHETYRPTEVDAIDQSNKASFIDIDRIVEILYTVADAQVSMNDRALLEAMADPDTVNTLSHLLSYPSVQQAVVAIAESERSHSGSSFKTAAAQLIKVLSKSSEVLDSLNRIPNLEQFLESALLLLKPVVKTELLREETKAKPPVRQHHECVSCDGCELNADLARSSVENGFCSPQGEILGIRYKSAVLPNFDLCEQCEASGEFQEHAGPFLKIIDPATAPELILCALPGATHGMKSQIEDMDWRNPLAREFLEFVQNRRQRAFPQQRSTPMVASAPPASSTVAAEESQVSLVKEPVVKEEHIESAPVDVCEPPQVTVRTSPIVDSIPSLLDITPQFRCKHLLKTFETPHSNFTCDICKQRQSSRSVLHGCRACNFDVCSSCNTTHNLPLEPAIAQPPAPQAKFVADITLADGCVVRPGEKLNKTWRVRNTGPERWPPGTKIGHVGGDSFGGPPLGVEVPLAAAGEAVNITVPLTMPTEPGRYTSYWRMMSQGNSKFGHRFWITVNVVPPMSSSTFNPTPVPPVPSAFFGRSTQPGVIIRPPQPSQTPYAPFVAGSPSPLAGAPQVPFRPAPLPPAQQEENTISPEFETAVAQIADFGFTDIDKIVRILKEVNGDTSAAIDRLLETN